MSDNAHNLALAQDKLLHVFAAVTLVEKVILSVVALFAEEYHHQTYQYVLLSDIPPAVSKIIVDKLLAVFAAVAHVENVILSVAAVAHAGAFDLYPQQKYQYVAQSERLAHWSLFSVKLLTVLEAKAPVEKVILYHVFTLAELYQPQ